MLRNVFVATVFLCWLVVPLFGGGQAESGRDSSSGAIASGQFVDPQSIDAESYLDSFRFAYPAKEGQDLSVFVKLEKQQALVSGDTLSLFIGLLANNATLFPNREGNYVVFIQNPGLLLYRDASQSIRSAILSIRGSMSAQERLGLFSAEKNQIYLVTDEVSLNDALGRIGADRKVYKNDAILSSALSCMGKIDNGFPTRFVWITDENLLKADTDANLLQFSLALYSQNKITVSYLGYGELPQWAKMNSYLQGVGGSSYFISKYPELQTTLLDDYKRFSHPTVEDIKVTVSLMPYIQASANDYRSQWYPALTNFRPTLAYYNRPRSVQLVKSLDYDQHKILIHYLSLDTQNKVLTNEYLWKNGFTNTIPVGTVCVEYYSHKDHQKRLLTYDLSIEYTRDWKAYAKGIDPVIQKYTLLQNTPYIIKEISSLVTNRNYPTAILLVDAQMKRLQELLANYAETQIKEDIDTLNKYKDLLIAQARSLNYIR
jgi:hypothetical protein